VTRLKGEVFLYVGIEFVVLRKVAGGESAASGTKN
jgi:hypothetical protein